MLTAERRAHLRRTIRWIVAGTIAYNLAEAIVAITAGAVASSAALVAFGVDSLVEVTSAVMVAWQFSAADPEQRERTALRVIAVSFFALAALVVCEAVAAFTGVIDPQRSTVGIVLTAVSVAVMPLLSWLERRAGRELGSASAVADSKQTLICAQLSGAVLLGLVANAAFGWQWADSLAALVIGVFAVREGREAWRGDACQQPVAALTGESALAAPSGCPEGTPRHECAIVEP